MALTLVLSACSAGNPDQPTSSDQGLTATSFDGKFVVEELQTGTDDVLNPTSMTITIDADAASVDVDSGCNTHLGSYSLFDDGTASFTLVGGTTKACDAELRPQDLAIQEALAAVDSWSGDTTTIVFESPDADLVTLRRA